MAAIIDKIINRNAPELSDEQKSLEEKKESISAQLNLCRSRIESVDLLASNEKPKDCVLLLSQLSHDFTELSQKLDSVSLQDESEAAVSMSKQIIEKTGDSSFSEESNPKEFWKTVSGLIDESDKCVYTIEKTAFKTFKSALATPLTNHRLRQKKKLWIGVSVTLVLLFLVYSGYREITRPQRKLQGKVDQAKLVLDSYGLKTDREKLQDLYANHEPATVRLTALVTNRALLQAYYSENAAYPVSRAWVKSCEKEQPWISGLPANAMADPASAGSCNNTFLYKSDGNDFKLLMQGNATEIRQSITGMADPVREDSAGFWTEDAKDW